MSNDHFYTTSSAERDNAFAFLGYIEEGIACYVYTSQASGTIPFYRYMNSSTHDHFYTTSLTEGNNAAAHLGYKGEGTACFVFATQRAGTQPLYRLVSPSSGDHFYTTSTDEADGAVSIYGYQREGVACYVFTGLVAQTSPLYRLLESSSIHRHETQSQWATLLCKFNNDKSEPPAAQGVMPWRAVCERFLTANDGSFNLVRFYADVSHGKLDLTGSQVLGWYDINVTLGPPDKLGDRHPDRSQGDVIALAIQAAKSAGVQIDKFVGVIVIMNVATGWTQGSPGSVAMDWRRLDGRKPDGTLLPRAAGGGNGVEAFAQEVGHGYGLDHSRIDGSNDDYKDQWDAMSTLSDVYSIADPDYCARPPAFNAWNMRARGWLDEARVWKTGMLGSFSTTIELRPLHQRDIAGWLCAELPGIGVHSPYLVEFRVPELWDAGIPRPTVLVHRFSGAEENGQIYSPSLLQQQLGIHSYLMKGTRGQPSLLEGDVFEIGTSRSVRVTVLKIDAASKVATIKLEFTA